LSARLYKEVMTSTQDSTINEYGHQKRDIALLIVAIAISLISAAVYLPALNNGFVDWDDEDYVHSNTKITNFDPRFIKWAFTTFQMANYHPLTWISYAIDYSLWGTNPFGYHLTNVLFHTVNTFLVVLLITRIFQAANKSGYRQSTRLRILVAAGITGILFGTHPLHVESVAWVSERKDVLYAFFWLLSLLAYLKYASFQSSNRRCVYYWICLIFFLLSLLSKPMAVTLSVVLLILDGYPLKRVSFSNGFTSIKKVLLEKLPFLGLSLASSVVTVMAQHSGKTIALIEEFSISDRVLTAIRAIGFYLLKLFYPTDLAPFYPTWVPVSFSIKTILAIIILLGITAFCLWSWRRSRIWMAVWVYYLVTLFPVLGIIQAGSQAVADRYTYMPMIGPMFLIGLGVAIVVEKMWASSYISRLIARVFVSVFSGLFIVMVYLTLNQIGVWKDTLSLWNRELAIYPVNVPMIYRSRAEAYYKAGNYNMAISDYTLAIQIDSRDYQSYSARGIIYFKTGRYDKAMADFDKALSIKPDYDEALYYRGLAYRKMQGNKEQPQYSRQ
jgi:hypothetical protein